MPAIRPKCNGNETRLVYLPFIFIIFQLVISGKNTFFMLSKVKHEFIHFPALTNILVHIHQHFCAYTCHLAIINTQYFHPKNTKTTIPTNLIQNSSKGILV